MNYITMFLKNRQRKKLQKKIDNLKIEATRFLEKSKNAKTSAASILSYVNFHQERAKNGNLYSISWLNCYLSDYLKNYQKFSESAATDYQHYENIQNQINFLNQQISKLDA